MRDYLPPLSDRALRWVRFFGLLAAILFVVWMFVLLENVVTPIVAALAIAYVLNPLVTHLEQKRHIRRRTSVAIGLGLLLIGGFVLVSFVTVQAIEFAGNVDEYFGRAVAWADEYVPILGDGFDSAASTQPASSATTQPDSAPATRPHRWRGLSDNADRVAGLARYAQEHGLQIGSAFVGFMSGAISNIGYWLTLCVTIPLFSFVFLVEFNRIVRAARDHLPALYRPTIIRIVTTIDNAVSNFFRGRLIVCLIVGTLTGFGWLIIGVPYNLLLGALAGTLNLVPFLSWLAVPPAIVLALIEWDSSSWIWALLLPAAVHALVQLVENLALTPVIEAKSSGLHPVTTFVALMIGAQLAGLLGMLLAIPMASTLKSLSVEYLLPEIRRLAAEETPVGPPPGPDEGRDNATEPSQKRIGP